MELAIRFVEEPYEVNQYGDWIDLRSVEDYEYKSGDFFCINLGVNIKLPEGYEGLLCPRSSTFKTYGVLQTNSVGIIDNTYCGNGDVWRMPVLAMRDGQIHKGDRVCQFRVLPSMAPVTFKVVQSMSDVDRGGLGSTGVN